MRAALNAARSKCGASVVSASASAMRRKSLPVAIGFYSALSPFVPAKAGTQVELTGGKDWVPAFRGDERGESRERSHASTTLRAPLPPLHAGELLQHRTHRCGVVHPVS